MKQRAPLEDLVTKVYVNDRMYFGEVIFYRYKIDMKVHIREINKTYQLMYSPNTQRFQNEDGSIYTNYNMNPSKVVKVPRK